MVSDRITRHNGKQGHACGTRRPPGRARRKRAPVVRQHAVTPLVFDGRAVLATYTTALPQWLSGGSAGVGASVRLVASLSRLSCRDGCRGLLFRGGPPSLLQNHLRRGGSATASAPSDSPRLVVAITSAPNAVAEVAIAYPDTLFLIFLDPRDVNVRNSLRMAAVGNCTPCIRVSEQDDASRSKRACEVLRQAGTFYGLAMVAPLGSLAAPTRTAILDSNRAGAYVGFALHHDELGGPHRLEPFV